MINIMVTFLTNQRHCPTMSTWRRWWRRRPTSCRPRSSSKLWRRCRRKRKRLQVGYNWKILCERSRFCPRSRKFNHKWTILVYASLINFQCWLSMLFETYKWWVVFFYPLDQLNLVNCMRTWSPFKAGKICAPSSRNCPSRKQQISRPQDLHP